MKLKAKFIKLSPAQRLYGLTVPVIGLTGGIASGKSTVGKMLEKKGLPLINADLLVKDVYALPESLQFIKQEFPEVIENNAIQFPKLRQRVFSDSKAKAQVESFIYQRLPQAFQSALSRFSNPAVIVYDVPLLFEKNMSPLFDLTLTVYAPRKIQLARLIQRDGHLEDLANKILDQQLDIEDKKRNSDFVIDNSKTEAELIEEVEQFLRQTILP